MMNASDWKGKSAGIPLSKFDKEQLKKGIKSEMEHTDDPSIAVRICADHLVEDPMYYTKLEKFHLDENKLREIIREIIKSVV